MMTIKYNLFLFDHQYDDQIIEKIHQALEVLQIYADLNLQIELIFDNIKTIYKISFDNVKNCFYVYKSIHSINHDNDDNDDNDQIDFQYFLDFDECTMYILNIFKKVRNSDAVSV
jgi:hypothetical protein